MGDGGRGGGVRGILLDSSVILDSTSNNNQTPSLRSGADYLLRKLRHSNIPTGICYDAVGLPEATANFLTKLICEFSFEQFIYTESFIDDTINKVSQTWDNNGGIVLHVVLNSCEGLLPKNGSNFGWMNVVVKVDGDGDGDGLGKNPIGIFIEKLEELPMIICELNKKTNEDNVIVGYFMKPSREADFAKIIMQFDNCE